MMPGLPFLRFWAGHGFLHYTAGNDKLRAKFYLWIIISFLLLVLSSCETGQETMRDPARNGFFLAEQMIQDQRYYSGLLMHRINASFFSEYPYGQKSLDRLKELNSKLTKSVQGRPPVEVMHSKSRIVKNMVYITCVNNTEKRVVNAQFEIKFFDQNNNILTQKNTGQQTLIRQLPQKIGPWGITVYKFAVSGFPQAHTVKAKVVSHQLRKIPMQ